MSLSSLQMQTFLSRHKRNSFSLLGPSKISFEAQPKQAYNQGTHILEITLNNLENVTLQGPTTYSLEPDSIPFTTIKTNPFLGDTTTVPTNLTLWN